MRGVSASNISMPFSAVSGVVQPRGHMQQMPQCYLCAAIARCLPFGHRRWLVKRKPAISHHQTHQSRGHALRHRPADKPRVRCISRRITFRDDAAALHDDQRARFRQCRVFKEGRHGLRQLFFANDSIVNNDRLSGRCRGLSGLCTASGQS